MVKEHQPALLRLEEVRKHFSGRGISLGRRRTVRAVDGVSFEVQQHETVSIVGESGCGKTTVSRLILRLLKPTSGHIWFRGTDIAVLKGRSEREYRTSVQAVFQDPWSSLSPRMRIGDIVAEPLTVSGTHSRLAVRERVSELLTAVGLEPTAARRFPHEFSGGMRQRIAIARALTVNPALLVLDEPVSALDVSIRAQIINLLKDLQEQFGSAYLLIAHDLATVRYLSQHVIVMYIGIVMESSPAHEFFEAPLHPYSAALISAALPLDAEQQSPSARLSGEVPTEPTSLLEGCRFRDRCWLRQALGDPQRCSTESPRLREVVPNRLSACHYAEEMTSTLGVRSLVSDQ